MALIGNLLKKGIILRESLEQQYTSPLDLQKSELRKLLINSQNTLIGNRYHFKELLKSFTDRDRAHFHQKLQNQIPIYDYDKIHDEFWSLSVQGQSDVAYPGRVKYFALSSGTSGSSSKYIPVTKDMIKSIRKTSMRQILSLSKCDLPDSFFTKGILMLGGSTNLRKQGTYFEGDLSGITAAQLPFWFQHFYKPGGRIARTIDWSDKLDEITLNAKKWDIGIIVGVPAWLQILIEKIVKHYDVATIHDIWPNLRVFVHGGVSFDPYRKGFQKLVREPLIYLETYLASEGFMAFQASPDSKSMRLVLNNGIYYEFIPFDKENFEETGEVKGTPQTLRIDQVKEEVDYAPLITTNAGAWRYLIGDVIRFTNVSGCEIVITGRTKHFLSLCGEHLSVDNMTKAIELISGELSVDVREFTVIGQSNENGFGHTWFIGTDDMIQNDLITNLLDEKLCELNDDYAVERKHALSEIKVIVLPVRFFYDWMKQNGKEGGQNKFPRVLKNQKSIDWIRYVDSIIQKK